ncbi:MAG: hypothetical protein KDG55_15820, partial [Rhodocyclaceae bacterium]|nr:hypothetical protein [Rhodocyclaceae bacterium]
MTHDTRQDDPRPVFAIRGYNSVFRRVNSTTCRADPHIGANTAKASSARQNPRSRQRRATGDFCFLEYTRMSQEFLFTSESVSEGHPDKVA